MARDLVMVGIAAVAVLWLALWRLDLVGRIRAALAELDGLTVEDDGERM